MASVCAILRLLYTEEYEFICHLPKSTLQESSSIPVHTTNNELVLRPFLQDNLGQSALKQSSILDFHAAKVSGEAKIVCIDEFSAICGWQVVGVQVK